jgi:ATP-dependent Clp protease ATP-binding subunit ClpB
VLDEGRLTDSQGRTVDFKNTVIVMTSNLGSQHIVQMAGQTFEAIQEAVWQEVKLHFRPEFLNRIDDNVVFHPLELSDIAAITRIQLKLLAGRLGKMEMRLEVSSSAVQHLARLGFDVAFGARPLKRVIQQHIENHLSQLILRGSIKQSDVVSISTNEQGEFVFAT